MTRWISTGIFGLGILLFGSAAWGQGSGADPTGAAPIGIITKVKHAPKLDGVLVVELEGLGAGTVASGARLTLRLHRRREFAAFFATLPGPIDTEDTPKLQADILDAFGEKVKMTFFEDKCGADGTECPNAGLVLTKIGGFALTDDGVENLITVMDIVLAMDRL